MKIRGAWILVAALAVASCGDDTTEPETFGTDELATELAITPDHIHMYQTVVTFTVSVTDPNGDAVKDFEIVQVERRLVGETTWEVEEAALDGDFYAVAFAFDETGDFEVRVTGLRASDDELVVLHEEANPITAIPPHEDIGEYHLELEPDPSHIHEGDTSDIRFWVVDDATEDPITGLGPTIWVEESDGTVSEYAATEGADGLYHAMHSFTLAGTTILGIRYVDPDTNEQEWSVEMEVHEAH